MAFRVPMGASFTGCVTVILPFLVDFTLHTPFRLMLTRVKARVNGVGCGIEGGIELSCSGEDPACSVSHIVWAQGGVSDPVHFRTGFLRDLLRSCLVWRVPFV